MKQTSIRFCGFGGQGVVLSAVVLGTSAVTRAGLYAVQTQSYGSEARGGQCQAELIISDRPINSPDIPMKDVLISMSQSALDRYFSTVRDDGVLIIDPGLVRDTHGVKARLLQVPATEIAQSLANRICANMVILGFVQVVTNLVGKSDLVEVIKDTVPPKFLDLDLRAFDKGIEFAKAIRMEAVVS